MNKKVMLSGMTLLTMLLAVGCSNNSTKSNDSEPKTTETHHKKSKKTNHHKKSVETDEESTDQDNSQESSQKSSSNSNSTSTTQNNQNSQTNSSTQTNNQQATGMTSTQIFNSAVSDTISRSGYPKNYTVANFSLIQEGNGHYALAEKSSGRIINHYIYQNGKLYYQDVITGKDVPIN